jgi:hypothetical protein
VTRAAAYAHNGGESVRPTDADGAPNGAQPMRMPAVIETDAMRRALAAYATARESLARAERLEGNHPGSRQQSVGPREERTVLRRMRNFAGEERTTGDTHAECDT